MASVSATSSANQYGLQQLMVQQARRNADQAEQAAAALKAQADDAQRVADQAQSNANSLSVQSDQAQQKAGQARQGLVALSAEQQGANLLSLSVDRVLARQQTSTPPAHGGGTATSAPAPVTNSQGQVTGRIVNTTA